ncbi:KAT8 regulatory NSL complex subunit 1-like protein [Larimichthys crocea]|uniref:Uncharacterized protein n=1 Tax=Larimichthys crocea TaxID=215358 RepID=A0ACD3QGF1_LARCR|nr:KAT8 regulatory NSL complex subunit 1-like protein [Larimichthys crocea]
MRKMFCTSSVTQRTVQMKFWKRATHRLHASRPHRALFANAKGESVYNINNVVIPMSAAKVEKLQYKDILTPSWRVVDTSPQMNRKAETVEDNEEGQLEDLTDEVFAQRHLALEQREKLRWGSWGKRKCCRRPQRSGSRLSGSGGVLCTSGEESSVELSCAQLDTDEQQSSEEWLQPQTPWEQRVFPLVEDDEEALFHSDLQKVPEWSECSSAFHHIKELQLPSLTSSVVWCYSAVWWTKHNTRWQLRGQCLTFLTYFPTSGTMWRKCALGTLTRDILYIQFSDLM